MENTFRLRAYGTSELASLYSLPFPLLGSQVLQPRAASQPHPPRHPPPSRLVHRPESLYTPTGEDHHPFSR